MSALNGAYLIIVCIFFLVLTVAGAACTHDAIEAGNPRAAVNRTIATFVIGGMFVWSVLAALEWLFAS